MRCWRPRRQKWEEKDGKFQPVLKEQHVLRDIVERLWLQARIKVWQINCPVGGKVRPNVPGIPDLVGWIPAKPFSMENDPRDHFARALFIEVKRPRGVRRPAQERFIQEACEGGCVAFFAESWADVCEVLKRHGVVLQGDERKVSA